MDPIQLLLLSVLLYGVGAVLSLLLDGSSQVARWVSGISGMVAAAPGCLVAMLVITGKPAALELPGVTPFGHFVLQIDGLSAFMIGIISLVTFATNLYSIPYLNGYAKRGLGVMGFFNNLFTAAMLMIVVVANAFFFLIFWELMTLTSYFLIIFDQDNKDAVKAGYIYFLVAHCGTAFIMLAFFVLYQYSGSYDFAAFRQATLSPVTRNLVFLLAFLGFGAKAGIVPMHIWLPRAHPAAPTHVSALLSGVAIKIAIYGILRICVDVLVVPAWWWGFLVMCVGIISAVLGILYALSERDIKRLLAYSSVENIGIILVGIGMGMAGMAIGQPVLALVGFLAALYHTINHALFKSLLFLGAGSVTRQMHTNNLDEMGGLTRLMPWTGLVFLLGSLSISAIPPFNGFVSEWLNYQSLFIASSASLTIMRVFAPIFAILLALAGALTAMCFVKAFGTAFTGPARSLTAQQAKEAPLLMLLSKGVLTVSCIFLGLGAPLVVPYIGKVAAGLAGVPLVQLVNGTEVFPATINQAVLSTPWIAVLMAGFLVVALLGVALYGGFRAGRKFTREPWACGYQYSSVMSVSASNFALPAYAAFRPLYVLRSLAQKPLDAIAASSLRVLGVISAAEPVFEQVVSRPTQRAVEYLADRFQRLQMGDIRVYCFYIVLTLAVLLIVVFR